MVTKACYVGEGFTRKPPKYERFIRPMVQHILLKSLPPWLFQIIIWMFVCHLAN
jgi:hypothetical protein